MVKTPLVTKTIWWSTTTERRKSRGNKSMIFEVINSKQTFMQICRNKSKNKSEFYTLGCKERLVTLLYLPFLFSRMRTEEVIWTLTSNQLFVSRCWWAALGARQRAWTRRLPPKTEPPGLGAALDPIRKARTIMVCQTVPHLTSKKITIKIAAPEASGAWKLWGSSWPRVRNLNNLTKRCQTCQKTQRRGRRRLRPRKTLTTKTKR